MVQSRTQPLASLGLLGTTGILKFANGRVYAIKAGGYVPSLAHGMAQPDAVAGAITDVVTKFMNSQQPTQEAIKALAQAAKTK